VDEKELEHYLRRLTVTKLRALEEVASSDVPIPVSGMNPFPNVERGSLGGVASTLSRTSINNLPIVLAVGKTGRGIRWRVNEDIAPRKVIHKVAKKIRKEVEG